MTDLAFEARRAVARSCLQRTHPPCIVLGYFADLLKLAGKPPETKSLRVPCQRCGTAVRLVG